MLTNSQVKSLLQDNLNADIMLHAQVFLSNLIERKKYGVCIDRYRIFDNVSNSHVTSLDDFISKIDDNSLVLEYDFNRSNIYFVPLASTRVILNNFIVKLSQYTEEDNIYLEKFGFKENGSKIAFILSYVDKDDNLPLKIIHIRLI